MVGSQERVGEGGDLVDDDAEVSWAGYGVGPEPAQEARPLVHVPVERSERPRTECAATAHARAGCKVYSLRHG
jgi:hypothetical protein